MNNEKYVFVQDVKEKKRAGRGGYNRKTHGGAVKFPSDYLSKKELKAMNGETTTYKMNEPLTWKEFRKMPDDIKIMYIKALRQKYHVPNTYIAEMMGVHRVGFSNEMSRLGLRPEGNARRAWDREGFFAWCKQGKSADNQPEEPTITEQTPRETETAKAFPHSGSMTFVGNVDAVLETLRMILGGATAKITVAWDASSETAVHDIG